MPVPDLNLLVTLDVLLAEVSVARAARRLQLSPSAMSRALARLRKTTGDPLLVRAGRGLVPTPRALELRERMGHALCRGKITPSRYAGGRHIHVSRRGLDKGPIDEALNSLGLERQIAAIVDGYSTALALARGSDLIASVPEQHTGILRAGMHS